ncbi:GNAT family N-acetyltransferase [Halorubrum trueperi]|uniref:GNAT family N-acetyltransferase n=1 Tax=Halorubrum trueperi TaxID=2004704 RepID=A0ABD5UJC9_9EURY
MTDTPPFSTDISPSVTHTAPTDSSDRIEIEAVTDSDRWNELVDASSTATPFHRFEALRAMATHSSAELHPLVGRSRYGPIGLFPVFSRRYGPVTVAFSPPPDLKVSYLGPAYLPDEPASNTPSERLRAAFLDAVTDRLADRVSPRYVHVRTAPSDDDPRPLVWNGYRPVPRYTYVVDLTRSVDDLFASFSGDLRENVRGADDEDYELTAGYFGDIERIVERLRARHDAQDVSYPLPAAFAEDLYEALPDGDVRVSVCRADGEFLGGQITLENDTTMVAWQGVGDHEHDLPVNDLLDWAAIKDARERGIERYDLVGANDPRLCGYKAKFNPALASYYSLERSGPAVDLLKRGYRLGQEIGARAERRLRRWDR